MLAGAPTEVLRLASLAGCFDYGEPDAVFKLDAGGEGMEDADSPCSCVPSHMVDDRKLTRKCTTECMEVDVEKGTVLFPRK